MNLTWINLAAVALIGLLILGEPKGSRLEFTLRASLGMLVAATSTMAVMLTAGPEEYRVEATLMFMVWLIISCVLLHAHAVQSGAHKTFAQMRDE